MEPLHTLDVIRYELMRTNEYSNAPKMLEYVTRCLLNKAMNPELQRMFSHLPDYVFTSYKRSQKCTYPALGIKVQSGPWLPQEINYLFDTFEDMLQHESYCFCFHVRQFRNAKDFFYIFATVIKHKTQNENTHILLNDVLKRYIFV